MSETSDILKESVTILLALVLVLYAVFYSYLVPGVGLPEYVFTFAMMGAQFLFGAAAGAFAVKNYVRATEATVAKLAAEKKVE